MKKLKVLFQVFVLSIILSFISTPANSWDNGTWGVEKAGEKTNWVINHQTMNTIGFFCYGQYKRSDFGLQVYLPMTKKIKKEYKLVSKKKNEWVTVARGFNPGQKVTFPNGRSVNCPDGTENVMFNWIPPTGIDAVQARIIFDYKRKTLPHINNSKNLSYLDEYGIIVHPQMKNAIQQASQQVAQNSGNSGSQNSVSAPQSNSGSAPQTRSSSAPFVNPYNIEGVGRVLQDGSIEYGVYYGGNRQLAIDLTSGNFYQAALNTATSESQAQQMCIASNLSSGDFGAATRC
jgi:hypothetical protein